MKEYRLYYLVLIAIGAIWGAVFPITKIALSTGHKPLGVMVWQMAISVILSGVVILARKRRFLFSRRYMGVYVGISLFGALLPNFFSYTATAELPAGVMSIVIALVPLFAMPVAVMLGFEKPSFIRILGAAFGAGAIVMIVGPQTGLPDPAKAGFVLVGLLAPFFYGLEGNFLTWYGARGLDAFQILFGATLLGLGVAGVISLALGQFINPLQPWGPVETSIVTSGALSWIAYVGYVWLIGKVGPVFSAQVAYLVTGWGVVWSMVFLGERYSLWVWAAFVLMLIGITLVRPRNSARDARLTGDDLAGNPR